MPGARCTRSLVCKIKKRTSIVTTVTPETPGIPYAMVLTVSFVLSPVNRALLPPSLRGYRFRRFDTSVGMSGPHDFAARETAPFVSALPTSIASRPASVTIASRPGRRDGSGYKPDLGIRKIRIFLQRGARHRNRQTARRANQIDPAGEFFSRFDIWFALEAGYTTLDRVEFLRSNSNSASMKGRKKWSEAYY
jgi:hypothetical protein